MKCDIFKFEYYSKCIKDITKWPTGADGLSYKGWLWLWKLYTCMVSYSTLLLLFFFGGGGGHFKGLNDPMIMYTTWTRCMAFTELSNMDIEWGTRLVLNRLWNNLPHDIQHSSTLNTFKSKLKTHFMQTSFKWDYHHVFCFCFVFLVV